MTNIDEIQHESIILDFVNTNQRDDDLKIIPDSIFSESKINFENQKLKSLYTNYGVAHGIGVSAIAVGSVVGFLAGPIGFTVGSGIGGLIWSIAGAASTMVDRCVISNKHIPYNNDYKYYKFYKKLYFGVSNEFSKYFPKHFYNFYEDTIKFKIDAVDSIYLVDDKKMKVYSGTITGIFKQFELIKIIQPGGKCGKRHPDSLLFTW